MRNLGVDEGHVQSIMQAFVDTLKFDEAKYKAQIDKQKVAVQVHRQKKKDDGESTYSAANQRYYYKNKDRINQRRSKAARSPS